METLNNNGMSKSENPASASAAGETWTTPGHVHIPDPSYMPIVMALGIMCMLWGIVTSPWMSLVGALLFVISITGWIGEVRHEHRHPNAE